MWMTRDQFSALGLALRQPLPLAALTAAGLLLVGGVLAPVRQTSLLLTALTFVLAAGLMLWEDRDLWLALPVSFGLVLLPLDAAWNAWLLVAGLGLVWMLVNTSVWITAPVQRGRLQTTLLIPAVIGLVLAASRQPLTPLEAEAALFGVGLLLMGSLAGLVAPRVVAVPAASGKPDVAASTMTRAMLKAAMNKQDTQEVARNLADAVANRLSDRISDRIRFSADGMVKAAQAIKEMTGQQMSGTVEQADVIHMNNQLLDTFLALAERAGQYTRNLNRAMQDAEAMAQTGTDALAQTLDRMTDIRAQVNAIGQTIVQLAGLTRRIDTIISSVSEIATQSNLLALNASIEAARAGTHGRGFAVVADEVRSLSQQSTEAARQVRLILADIQTAVRATIDAAESGTTQADTGEQETRATAATIQKLADAVIASGQTVRSISDILREQSDGMEAVAIDMERLDRLAQQNLISVRVIEQVTQNLLQLAEDLDSIVDVTPAPVSPA